MQRFFLLFFPSFVVKFMSFLHLATLYEYIEYKNKKKILIFTYIQNVNELTLQFLSRDLYSVTKQRKVLFNPYPAITESD